MDGPERVGGGDSARFTPPQVRAASVERTALITALRRRFERRLTVLEGGAGFGKTTALAQAVRENRIERLGRDVWLRVDARDRDPLHLCHGLGAALGLDGAGDPAVDSLIDAVWGAAPDAVALVIDDCHTLGDSAEAWQVLAELLDRLPANGHLVISGRVAPRLPVARLRAQDQAIVIDEEALAFDDEEIAELAARRSIGPALAAELPRWPALATLTGAVGQSASIEFLWDEVISGLGEQRRRLLAAAAALGEIDDELLGALGGDLTAAELVAGLPLVDRAGGGGFTLHDLWGDALDRVLSAQERAAALRAGGAVLAERGELVRAAQAFSLAGDEPGLHGVVLQLASRPSLQVSTADIDRVLGLLPSTARSRPWARHLEAARCFATDDREAASLFRAAAEEARRADEAELEVLARWRALQLDDLDRVDGPEADPRLEELAASGAPRASAVMAFAASRRAQVAGDAETARAELAGLDGFDPEQRATSRAIRLIDLGRPEAVPASLEEVLAQGGRDIYAAQAVWMQGLVAPELAWPVARELPGAARDLSLQTRVSLNSVIAIMGVSAGAHDEARALIDASRPLAPSTASTVELFVEVAGALLTLAADSEEAGVAALRHALDQIPLGRWPERPYLYALCALRALVPEAEVLDRCEMGPSLSVAVQAGAALAAHRSGDDLPATALPWAAAPTLLRVHVPPPLLAELALAAGDTPGAEQLLASLPHLRSCLRRLAERRASPLADRAADRARALPHRPPHDLRIGVLGSLRVERSDGEPVTGWDRRERVRSLLAFLSLRRDVPRAEVAQALWPDLPGERAAANLKVNLHHLQAALQPERESGEPPWFIRTDGVRLRLATEGLTTDLEELDGHMAAAVRAEAAGLPSRAVVEYRAADALVTGDLLPELDTEWVTYERLRVRSVAHAAACRLGELVLARGEPEEAMTLALRALRHDPLSERAHRLFIRCHQAVGSTSAARDAATRLRQTLADAGITAEPETDLLLARLDR